MESLERKGVFVFPGGGIIIGFCWPARGPCVGKVAGLCCWREFHEPGGAPVGRLGFEARRSRIGAADPPRQPEPHRARLAGSDSVKCGFGACYPEGT